MFPGFPNPSRASRLALTMGLCALAATMADARELDAGASTAIRDAISRHELQPLEGEPITVGELSGEIVVVSFWATWCKPCHKELAVLDELHARLSGADVRVAAVSIDRDARRVKRFLDEHGLSLPVYHDGPEGLVRTLDLDYFPFTVVIDRAGDIAYSSSDTSDEALAALVERVDLLASATPGRVAEGGAR